MNKNHALFIHDTFLVVASFTDCREMLRVCKQWYKWICEIRLDAHRSLAHRLLTLGCIIFGGYIRDEYIDSTAPPSDIDAAAPSGVPILRAPPSCKDSIRGALHNCEYKCPKLSKHSLIQCDTVSANDFTEFGGWIGYPVTHISTLALARIVHKQMRWGCHCDCILVHIVRVQCVVQNVLVKMDLHSKLPDRGDFICNGFMRRMGVPDEHMTPHLQSLARKDCFAKIARHWPQRTWNGPVPDVQRISKMRRKGFAVTETYPESRIFDARGWPLQTSTYFYTERVHRLRPTVSDDLLFPALGRLSVSSSFQRPPSRGLGKKFVVNKKPACLNLSTWRNV